MQERLVALQPKKKDKRPTRLRRRRAPPGRAPNSESLREQAIERPISNLMDRGRPCRDESHFFCLWRWGVGRSALGVTSETISPLPSAPVARDNNRSSGKRYGALPHSRTANTYSRARRASGSPPSASATAFSKFCVSGLPCVGATKAANFRKTSGDNRGKDRGQFHKIESSRKASEPTEADRAC